MDQPIIRFATTQDVLGMMQVQYSAIHDIAARDYPDEIISDWAPPITDESIEKYVRDAPTNQTILVAEVNETIAGFGAILESKSELFSLYVAVEFCNRRIGSILLQELERLAARFPS